MSSIVVTIMPWAGAQDDRATSGCDAVSPAAPFAGRAGRVTSTSETRTSVMRLSGIARRVDDHRDVLVAVAGVSPDVLVDTDRRDPVEPVLDHR